MSVILSTGFDIIETYGKDHAKDPRDTRGQWTAGRFATVGDGSGGSIFVDTKLSKGFIYTVERASMIGSTPPVDGIIHLSQGAEFQPDNPPIATPLRFACLVIGSAIHINATLTYVYWSRPFKPSISAGRVVGEIPNVLGQTVNYHCWGHIWDKEAFDLPGGPQRPEGGVITESVITNALLASERGFNFGQYNKGGLTERWWRDTRGWPFRKRPGQWGRL